MPDIDWYRALQVDPSAEPEVIQAAYRRLAAKYHPDVNSGTAYAEGRMKAINAAYSVLSDPQRRREYDEERHEPTHGWEDVRSHPSSRAVRPRPRFQVEPLRAEIHDVDPLRAQIVLELRLRQVGGAPFRPELDPLEFTMQQGLRHAYVADVTYVSLGPPILARVTVDLAAVNKRLSVTFGGMNLRGDSSAYVSVVVHYRTRGRTVPSRAPETPPMWRPAQRPDTPPSPGAGGSNSPRDVAERGIVATLNWVFLKPARAAGEWRLIAAAGGTTVRAGLLLGLSIPFWGSSFGGLLLSLVFVLVSIAMLLMVLGWWAAMLFPGRRRPPRGRKS